MKEVIGKFVRTSQGYSGQIDKVVRIGDSDFGVGHIMNDSNPDTNRFRVMLTADGEPMEWHSGRGEWVEAK